MVRGPAEAIDPLGAHLVVEDCVKVEWAALGGGGANQHSSTIHLLARLQYLQVSFSWGSYSEPLSIEGSSCRASET